MVSVLHSVNSLDTSDGGPSRSITALVDSLGCLSSMDVALVSQGFLGEQRVASSNLKVSKIVAESNSKIALKFGFPFLKCLLRQISVNQPDFIHSHGIWLASNYWTCRAAIKHDIPLIISIHGMLQPWAFLHKSWKKRFAMSIYQRHDLNIAKLLVATSIAEYESIRAFGFKQPIAIIPNGVITPPVISKSTRFLATDETVGKVRTVLFLSRISPVKGLLNLVDAWALIRPINWQLQIVGPDNEGYLSEVLIRIRNAGLSGQISYFEEVDDSIKKRFYEAADIFVLPSLSENFGLVIAEALSHGLPVICTKGTPWEDIEKFKWGWWVDIGVEPLAGALQKAMGIGDVERMEMGMRGRDYIKKFNWAEIALMMKSMYCWASYRGDCPDFVRND